MYFSYRLKVQRKTLRDSSNPFDVGDSYFIRHYRLNKSTAKYLIDFLEPHCIPDTHLNTIPFHLRVLCSLIFYGHGPVQKIAGLNFDLPLSQTSVSRCIRQVTQLIVKHLTPALVKFPTAPEHKLAIKNGFYTKFSLPGIIGAIDGVHIAILSPPNNSEGTPGHLYRNRKGYHSINALIVCDSDLKILYADARYPGSVHDAAIWQVSSLKQTLKSSHNRNSWLLGDSGYPIEPWLLTPFANPVSITEKQYNKMHAKARNVIERCFGVLKSRFRCVHRYKTLYYDPLMASNIIYATCTLHNLCCNMNDQFNETEETIDDIEDITEPEHELQNRTLLQEGRSSRQKYIQDFIANQ